MQSTMATTSTTSKYVKWSSWDTQANRYMQPKIGKGVKTVAVISTQKNKKLHIQLPAMTCWGISDYTDQATGESDGRYSIKLHFSGKEMASQESKDALEKIRAFEQQVLNDAVTNSEAWFGKKQSREIVEYGYFPFLKMGKNADTKQPDPEKGVYFRPKVNCYSEKWDVEIFDPEGTPIFPSENAAQTPMDFVPSGSTVTCGIECKQIWIGAKGWGISWALKQCVVIPKMVEIESGRLLLDLSPAEKSSMYNAPIAAAPPVDEDPDTVVVETKAPQDTHVDDSDSEQEETVDEPVKEEEPPKPVAKKTVVKKAVAPPPAPEESEAAAEPEAAAPAPTKKKVVRKKA